MVDIQSGYKSSGHTERIHKLDSRVDARVLDTLCGYKNGGYGEWIKSIGNTECMQEWWMDRVDTRVVDTRVVDTLCGYKNGGYTECMQEWWMNRVDTRMVDEQSGYKNGG